MHPLVRQSHNGPPGRKAEDDGVSYKLFGLGMLSAMETVDTMDSRAQHSQECPVTMASQLTVPSPGFVNNPLGTSFLL